jgi:hypothetical protein
LEELGDDLAGAEVALEPGESPGAEHAAHGAADLGGDADGLARIFGPDALLRDADDDGLDEGPVAELKQELVGDVLGLLGQDEARRASSSKVSASQARSGRERSVISSQVRTRFL